MTRFWSRHVALVVTAPILATVLLASAMVAAPVAESLVGDSATEGEQPYAVRLEIGAHDRACSGALVEEFWVLTAASCFVGDPAQYATLAPGAPALTTRAIVGRTDLTSAAGTVRNVVELVPMTGRDLTLARLSSAVTNIEPVSLSHAPADLGDTVEVSGYGRTAGEWAPLRLHRESFTVAGRTAKELQIDGQGGGAICMGDGGGPVVGSGVYGDVLVAVASRSWQGGCFGSVETRTAAVATRVDEVVADEIGARVARFALESRRSDDYVSAEPGRGDQARRLRAASTEITAAETFTLHTTDGGETIAFRSAANGRFVAAEVERTDSYRDILRARTVTPGAGERFTLARMDLYYAIRAEVNGEYVRVPMPVRVCCDDVEDPDDYLLRADGGDSLPAPALPGPGPGCPSTGPVPLRCPSPDVQFRFEHLDNFRINGAVPSAPRPMPYPDNPPIAATPPDELPFAVEDFNYPGADRILAERGIELKRGDGHIVLADCAGENLLRISARGQANQAVCFRVTGNDGWLTLELPGAFLVRTNNYDNTHLELEADSGDTQSFDVGPNGIQSIGESDPESGGQEFALLEIRMTR